MKKEVGLFNWKARKGADLIQLNLERKMIQGGGAYGQ